MPRVRWAAPLLLIPLLVPSPAAAQAATISVDDDTPNVNQTVNVTTTCPGPGTFLFVSVTIFTIPARPNAADPPFFFSVDATSTFPLTFNVADDFSIRASCTYAEGTAPSSELVLAVTPTPPTDTGAPPTDSGAPPTDSGAPPTATVTPPTTGAVSPTSAANVTTDPGQLPPTGASDSTVLVAILVLGLGAFVLLVTRKFRALDD
ncbi:MAG: hypothetical protein ABWZ15_14400 [Acidimicrobiia bacterium]